MAVERDLTVAVVFIEQGLEFFLAGYRAAFEALILLVRISLVLFAAEHHGVETVYAGLAGNAAVHLHAGHHNQSGFRREVLEIVVAVIGQRHKIIAVGLVQAQGLFRRTLAVGTGGVAVQRPLEQGHFAGKSCLTNHKTYLPISLFYRK